MNSLSFFEGRGTDQIPQTFCLIGLGKNDTCSRYMLFLNDLIIIPFVVFMVLN